MAIVHVNDQNFDQEVSSGVTIVDFWAPWCGPCKMIAPVLEEIDSDMNDSITIAKLNVDENQETAAKYGVMSIPTLYFFKDGEVVDKAIGFQPKEMLMQRLNQHI